jgi:hypothetical protein
MEPVPRNLGAVDEVVLDSGNAFNGAHSGDQAASHLVALHLPENVTMRLAR